MAIQESKRHTLPISNIKIGPRFRKDLGDITTLAESIQEIGLLHPIVVNENNELIAGQRRLEACKSLGWDSIPVTVISISEITKATAEFHENTVRKDFTPKEHFEIQRIYKPELTKEAEQREKAGIKAMTPSSKLDKGRTDQKIADYLGIGKDTLRKEITVFEVAEEHPKNEFIQQVADKMNNKEYSVDKAFSYTRKELKSIELEAITDPQTDLEILSKLGISIRPYDVWNFAFPKEVMEAGQEQTQTAHLIFNLLYFKTEPNAFIIDPMAGGGVVGRVAKIMKRRYKLYDIEPAHEEITKLDFTKEQLPLEECKNADLVYWDPPYYLYDHNNNDKKDFFLQKSNELYELGTKRLALLFPIHNENRNYNGYLLNYYGYINSILSGKKWKVIREIHCPMTIQQPIPPNYYEEFYNNSKFKPFRIMSGSLIIFDRIKQK